MDIQVRIPSAPLNEAIAFFWSCRADSFDAHAITLPLSCHEFVFTRSDGFETGNYSGSYNTRSYSSWFSGLHTEPIATRTRGRHLSLGMMLRPWGLRQLFDVSPRELTNDVVEGSLLAGNALEEVLGEHGELDRLEDFVRRQYTLRSVGRRVVEAVEKIEASLPGRGLVDRLAGELAISSKTFIAAFADTIGLTPVQYLHLSKVNRALAAIHRNPAVSLTELALQLGFYDQAHFIRVFRSFCKFSPRAYKKKFAAHLPPGSVPNSLVLPGIPQDGFSLRNFFH